MRNHRREKEALIPNASDGNHAPFTKPLAEFNVLVNRALVLRDSAWPPASTSASTASASASDSPASSSAIATSHDRCRHRHRRGRRARQNSAQGQKRLPLCALRPRMHYLHTCVHACIQANVHACVRTFMHTCMRVYMHLYSSMHYADIHARMHTCIRACTREHV
jgi:hypothetical protein